MSYLDLSKSFTTKNIDPKTAEIDKTTVKTGKSHLIIWSNFIPPKTPIRIIASI